MVGNKPYSKNSRTSPDFLMTDLRDFEVEKAKFIVNINKVQTNGESYYEGRENPSFGPLKSIEWNNLYSKHIAHHFEQFGL